MYEISQDILVSLFSCKSVKLSLSRVCLVATIEKCTFDSSSTFDNRMELCGHFSPMIVLKENKKQAQCYAGKA